MSVWDLVVEITRLRPRSESLRRKKFFPSAEGIQGKKREWSEPPEQGEGKTEELAYVSEWQGWERGGYLEDYSLRDKKNEGFTTKERAARKFSAGGWFRNTLVVDLTSLPA